MLSVLDLDSTNGTFVNGHRIVAETPLQSGDVVQFGNAPFQVSRDAPIEVDHTQAELVVDRATTLLQFDRLMSQRAVTPHFQPIVTLGTQTIIGFEVLARSRVLGLESAQALFDAAALVQQETQLSRLFRDEGLRNGLTLTNVPELFLNTHPAELDDDRLVASLRELRNRYPRTLLTLEVHEGTITDSQGMRKLHDELRALHIKLAYDDFGAGQARLVELVDVPAELPTVSVSSFGFRGRSSTTARSSRSTPPRAISHGRQTIRSRSIRVITTNVG
jgi:EAL domain-containing protein (putative c-di-GMP-specific phosphodiesterase class I)